MEGDVALRFRGIERSVAVKLEVRIEHRTCLDCSRRSGHFYTAQIQLRAPEEPRREPARALRARLAQVWDLARQETQNHWEQAVSFAEELPEGWDYFFTDTLAARGLARWMKNRFHAELKESASLWGRKDGRDVYRVTFCLRVPKGAPEAKSSPRTVRPRGPLRKSSRVQRQA
jgi:nonsense-mediated mRNA decay protein 3